MELVTQLLTHDLVKNSIPVALKNMLTTGIFGRLVEHTSSRNMNDALRQTYKRDWNSSSSMYTQLTRLCGYYLTKRVNVCFGNFTVSSDSTLTDLVNNLPKDYETMPNDINIQICYVPRGKSFLEKLLNEECADVERIKPIENYAKESNAHYVRIFKNFPVNRFAARFPTGNTTTLILTDIISEHLINTMITMAPLLIGIPQPDESAENAEDQKRKHGALMAIFESLFRVYTSHADAPDCVAFRNTIKTFTDLYPIEQENLEKFTRTLSTIRSTKIKRAYESQINDLTSSIRSYEQSLEEKYEKLSTLNKNLAELDDSPIDTKPFIEFIQKAPTIEVLDSSPTRLTLRITAPLQYFRESDFETWERNNNSEYNERMRRQNPTVADANKSILHKIFVTREYKLNIQAIIYLQLTTGSSTVPMSYSVDQYLGNYTEFPNPHLFHYNCWDRAKNNMSKALAENKFEVMLAQMVAAVQSINIAEAASFSNRFMEDWFNGHYQNLIHITDSEGHVYTLQEILEKEQELLKTPPQIVDPTDNIIPPTDVEYFVDPETGTPTARYVAMDNTTTLQAFQEIQERLDALETAANGGYTQIEISDEEGE